MLNRFVNLAVGTGFLAVFPLLAPALDPTCAKPTEAEVAALFERWNTGLKTLDPDKVLGNYAKTAVLLPTLSDEIRTKPERIRDYFVHFLENDPTGSIDQRAIATTCDVAVDSGLYTFKTNKDDKPDQVRARYTSVYMKEGADWRIVNHHSSRMPEATNTP